MIYTVTVEHFLHSAINPKLLHLVHEIIINTDITDKADGQYRFNSYLSISYNNVKYNTVGRTLLTNFILLLKNNYIKYI